MKTNLLDLTIVGLAAGRVTYLIARDDIFRPVREFVYKRSAPHADEFLIYGPNGDETYPARMVHRVPVEDLDSVGPGAVWLDGNLVFDPSRTPRTPGWLGQLIECPFCVSFWVAVLFTLAYLTFGDKAIVTLLPLAVWAVANAVAVWFTR